MEAHRHAPGMGMVDGQEVVFRYPGRMLTGKKSRCFRPKLWCFLVAPVLCTTVTLALTVNLLWKVSFEGGLQKVQETDDILLRELNESSTDILNSMTHQMQEISALFAVTSISEFTHWPSLATDVNLAAIESFPSALELRLDRIIELFWGEISKRFNHVDYLGYGDRTGVFIGLERLPKEFTAAHDFDGHFGGEFRPSDLVGATRQSCSLCPPPSVLTAGEKTYYFVNNKTGKYVSVYTKKAYDPRVRPWWKLAVAAKGKPAWTDIYNYSSGHSLGMSCSQAIMFEGEVVAVLTADFTVSYLSKFLRDVTDAVPAEEGFVLDSKGFMVASSLGIDAVAKLIFDQGHPARVRYHWTQLQQLDDLMSPVRTLLQLYGSLEKLPPNGTMSSADGLYLFTYTSDLHTPFQDEKRWTVIISRPISSYLGKAWAVQQRAAKRNQAREARMADQLHMQELQTILYCGLFALAGALIMILIGFAVSKPLHKISLQMLSMAKLEFLQRAGAPMTSMKRGDFKKSTRFSSFRSFFSRLHPDHSHHSSSSSDDDSSSSEEEIDLEEEPEPGRLSRMLSHVTPQEVVHMRESFVYMVAGLKSFARYMDPEIMRIVVQSKRQAQLGMGKAPVTIFFSDIANFTTIAESLDPETFMGMLSDYLDEMSKIIMGKRGIVGEFIGDAIMAWWNAPIDLGARHTELALSAALDQQDRVSELREKWMSDGLPEVHVRMGLVRGTVLAGNIGSSQRMKYGLVGDSVNLASRLEGLCKFYGVCIIVEEEAASAPGVREKFRLRLLDLVTVKGRHQETELFQLVGVRDYVPDPFHSEEEVQFFTDGFAQVHALYRSQQFQAAHSLLCKYREQFPQDVPSKLLLQRVETLLHDPPPAEWTPVYKLTEK
ncbi:cya1 [Symbiodinium natans]|uniref:Cya1 protein n=1 Tax=Symbiodinium natans TaxID=878477 RepID=A0A812UMN8_9DINO|nr:cya1 [Symbiodinium natans]